MAKQTFTTGQVLTAAQVNSLQSNDFNQTVSAKTASYTLVAADKGTRIEFNTSGSVTCTVNSGLFDAGDTLIIQNRGAGTVTVTAGTATVNTSATLALAQYDAGTLYFISDSAAIFFNTDAGGGSPLTTKGDIYTYSTADARLAVGSNGDTLVADSAATTGLRWNINQSAGKNAIINGDFRINQRAFTSTTTNGTYGFDRWLVGALDGTTTYSAETFTLGTAPVAGYEGVNFARIASTGQTSTTAISQLQQRIEDVRSFANQTITVSFWAKAASGTPKVTIEMRQVFGSGGSPSSSASATPAQVTLNTSWTRYSATIAVPSISGKTLGTTAGTSYLALNLWTSAGTDFNSRTNSLGIQTATIDFWGVQVEAGSVATAFQTATGTLQGELAACQRYYQKSYLQSTAPGTATTDGVIWNWVGTAGTGTLGTSVKLPVTMRIAPTLTIYDGSGNSAKCFRGAANKSVGTQTGSDGTITVFTTDATSSLEWYFHFVASAEL